MYDYVLEIGHWVSSKSAIEQPERESTGPVCTLSTFDRFVHGIHASPSDISALVYIVFAGWVIRIITWALIANFEDITRHTTVKIGRLYEAVHGCFVAIDWHYILHEKKKRTFILRGFF